MMSMVGNDLDICDLNAVSSADLSQYVGVITIEEPDTADPFRTAETAQLVLQFHDIDMTMLGYIEPEPFHVERALVFARETKGSLLVHCRVGVSRSTAIALAVTADRFGAGKERQACEWLRLVRPHAKPNQLVVIFADQILGYEQRLWNAANEIFCCDA
jgi:predicted protein tyrosine phosphatase